MNTTTAEKACSLVKRRIGEVPEIALVLGSGLGNMADTLKDSVTIPYSDIPGFPVSTAPGHASKLVCGNINGIRILIFRGRFHHYEGYSMEQIAYPVRFLKELGCRILILTNASGGINRSYTPGDLMLITDHLNLTGLNPLTGPNNDSLGERFPDLSRAYSSDLRNIAQKAASELGIPLKEGVYAWMTGPSFETPAEIHMLEIMGADAVGMSTVPEVITAVHAGMEVLGISCISNMASGIIDQPITADEVIEIGKSVTDKFTVLLNGIISLCGTKA